MVEAPDCTGRVGHQEDQGDCPRGTESANDEELVSPRLQGTLDAADAVACCLPLVG